jgi:hypothetical protein
VGTAVAKLAESSPAEGSGRLLQESALDGNPKCTNGFEP